MVATVSHGGVLDGARPNEMAASWGDVDGAPGVLRIRLGRYRGHEGPPKTASSVRDIDLLPAVVCALKVPKAQQAAERLKVGRGAPEPGQDYVFTGPAGGFLNVNALSRRTPSWVAAMLGHARARDALRGLRAVHSQSHTARRECVMNRMDGTEERRGERKEG
jgi:hypothetical protein